MSHHRKCGIHFSAKGMIAVIPLLFAIALIHSSCAREKQVIAPPPEDVDIPLNSTDIEKKYLSEGFIGSDLYRVVIVRPKGDTGSGLETIKKRASIRARVSMERTLIEEDVQCNRNTRAALLSLIEENGMLKKTDIEHSRYDIYYFDIQRTNMKQYLKRVSSER